MSDHPISRFPVPALADLPDDIRTRIEAVQEKSGFVPNVFLVLARRPEEFRAFFAYHDAIMEKDGNLTKAEREAMDLAMMTRTRALQEAITRRTFEKLIALQKQTDSRTREKIRRSQAIAQAAAKRASKPPR